MDFCSSRISKDTLQDVFLFTCERMRRYEGSWHTETVQMFPGYLFMETEDVETLEEKLRECPSRIHAYLQEQGEGRMLRCIQPEEESFLRTLCGRNHHLSMSRGYIRNGSTYVIQGPLMGMERQIRKIDRHKRTARVTSSEHSPAITLTAGLEITEKS